MVPIIVFVLFGAYVMPVAGFVFVTFLLKSIERIVKCQSYKTEAAWAGLSFSLIVWTIALLQTFNL